MTVLAVIKGVTVIRQLSNGEIEPLLYMLYLGIMIHISCFLGIMPSLLLTPFGEEGSKAVLGLAVGLERAPAQH